MRTLLGLVAALSMGLACSQASQPSAPEAPASELPEDVRNGDRAAPFTILTLGDNEGEIAPCG